MKRVARALAVLFGIVVLGSFVSLVPQTSASGAGGAPVNIMSPIPLPVKGNVSATVSGTVAAQQSGDWNVGLSGTPTVQLANTTTPLLVKSVDEPGRVPYNHTVEIAEANSGCTTFFCDSRFTFPAVPANKRLVIQHVSANLRLFSGGVASQAYLGPGTPPGSFGHMPPLTLQDSFAGRDDWITSQQVTFYVEPLQQPTIDVFGDGGHIYRRANRCHQRRLLGVAPLTNSVPFIPTIPVRRGGKRHEAIC